MAFTTYTIAEYLESKAKLAEKITAIDNLIDKMILSMAEVISGPAGTMSEYWLDDGQVKIKTSYRGVKEVEAGIQSLERMKQMYVNRFNGRIITAVDQQSFRR